MLPCSLLRVDGDRRPHSLSLSLSLSARVCLASLAAIGQHKTTACELAMKRGGEASLVSIVRVVLRFLHGHGLKTEEEGEEEEVFFIHH